jgi:hypothetical protein
VGESNKALVKTALAARGPGPCGMPGAGIALDIHAEAASFDYVACYLVAPGGYSAALGRTRKTDELRRH